jgi:hypothetical protein
MLGQRQVDDSVSKASPDFGEQLAVVRDAMSELHRQRGSERWTWNVEHDAGRSRPIPKEALEGLHGPDEKVRRAAIGEADVERDSWPGAARSSGFTGLVDNPGPGLVGKGGFVVIVRIVVGSRAGLASARRQLGFDVGRYRFWRVDRR